MAIDEMITLEDIGRLDETWQEATEFIKSPIQSYEWIKACMEAFVDAEKVRAYVFRVEGVVHCIAPLAPSQENTFALGQVGVELVHEPMDLIYKDDVSLVGFLREFSKYGIPLYLSRIPDDSQLINHVKQSYRGKGVTFLRPRASYPYIEFRGANNDVCDYFAKRHCSDLNRKKRKADSLGTVRYEIHSPQNAAEFIPLFDQALEVEAKSWKGRKGTALKLDKAFKRFYQCYGVLASESGTMRVCFLLIDDIPAAMQLAVEFKERFWLLKIGYDDNFAVCSPGGLLMLHTITYAQEKGLSSYEFLGTSAPWTKRWTEKERLCFALRVYPFNWPGLAALLGNASQKARQKLNLLPSGST